MTTWVLLRGLTREQAHWGDFPKQLTQAHPDAHCIALDLPGAGQRHRERCPWRVQDIAHACREELRRNGVPAPYHLLGLSLGGMVAAAWCAAWSQEIAGCVLVNTSLRPFSAVHQRLRIGRIPSLLRLLASRDARRTEQAILRLTSSAPAVHAGVIDAWVAIRAARPVSAANAWRQLAAAARYRHDGARPEVPMLVVSSAQDRLVDPACSRQLAAQWQVPLVTHPHAGHDVPLDAGPWLAEQIAAWSGDGSGDGDGDGDGGRGQPRLT